MKRKILFIVVTVILFLTSNVSFGQTAPNLGATSNFALFTATGAFNGDGASTITGDIGTNAGAFTGPGTLVGVSHVADAVSATAATDVATAYSSLTQGGSAINVTVLDGLVLTPGVYTIGAASSLSANGVLTLDGQGNPNSLFIIQIGGALTTSTSSNVILINSASPNNVYWQINGAFSLGAGSVFRGTIVANGAINLFEGSTLFGRGLTKTGEINLHNNIVTIPTYFRSKVSGDWINKEIWESSSDNTNWINAVAFPTADAISISISNGHTVTITDNSTASTLTINPGAHLTLNSGQTLTATKFNINSDATNGTGTFVDLNSTGGLTVSGTTNVQQYLTNGRNWYVSSPVSGTTSNVFAASSSYPLYYYDEAHGSTTPWPQITNTSTLLGVMTGYVANVAASGAVTFTGGTLNTGSQQITLYRTTGQTKEGFNLVGNPYPSYINWESATKTSLLSTMWYRTKNSSNAYYVFDTYNAIDHLGTGNNGTAVTQYIPPMQAVWVRVTAGNTGTLGFDNTMRSHQDQSVTTNRLKAPAEINTLQQVLRLQVSNGINSDEAIVLFNPNASDGYDAYDSPKMSNNDAAIPEIYTLAGTEQVVINGLNSVTPNEELPLGFTTGTSNTFTIKATEISNFDAETKIVLKDNNLLNTEQELTVGSAYSFTSDVASTTDRFSVIFRTTGAVTGIPTAANDPNLLVYRNANNQIAVQIKGQLNDSYALDVYNSVGQRLAGKQVTAGITIIDAPQSGVYFVTVKGNGINTTKKVVIN